MTACFRVSVLLCLGAPFAALEDHSLGLAQKLYGWWHAWRCLQFAVRCFLRLVRLPALRRCSGEAAQHVLRFKTACALLRLSRLPGCWLGLMGFGAHRV